ncbi:thiamine phosphate synthase [Marinobacterium sedimentorum]|uniref:thiamine phosphate synthase n=1 Tax=Marinobacterium sedimentorum TaxID=2927804 RepID=UPI0020C5F749|nr:thiamine phosphate synthase [Marinobacterium sedimentorum]MCP8689702.1 thiamine phosphate synthase [Marinobacterium sedimentorum]
MTAYSLHGLYAITDSSLMPDDQTLLSQVRTALEGGASIVQYRDKSDDSVKRLRQATLLRELCDEFERPLLINDDLALAIACKAQGVHLGQTDGSVAAARAQLGPDAIIGVTCHDSLALALEARAEGADYVAFGAFFASSTKPDARPAPLSLLPQAARDLGLPVVAIGGISMDNARQVIEAGASMVAVIHALFAAADIRRQAQLFSQQF